LNKATTIRGLDATITSLEETEDEGFNLDGELYRIRQVIGSYAVFHTLRQPTEGERRTYQQKYQQATYVQGSQRAKARMKTNLKIAVDLYDKLFIGIEGVSGIGDMLKQIYPIWKRNTIIELMKIFESSLSD
jgi:hypothetical protein